MPIAKLTPAHGLPTIGTDIVNNSADPRFGQPSRQLTALRKRAYGRRNISPPEDLANLNGLKIEKSTQIHKG